MISFNLRCGKDHVFEAWFKDGKTYDRQAKQGKVACPVCGDVNVAKAPMAPNIAKGASRGAAGKAHVQAKELRKTLEKLQKEVAENCDYVGDKFADEARKIHYKEADERNIYGETSDEDARSLEEEGIEFARIPWLPRTNS